MSKKIDTDFGERLRQAAEKAKVPYSQTPLADFLGVRKQNVDAWMNGSLPKADQIFTMADKLGVDPRWLATGQTAIRAIPDNQKQRLTAEKVLAAVKIMLQSDEQEVEEILASVQALTGSNATTPGQRNKAKRPVR